MISSGLENMKHLKLTAWFLHIILGFLAYKAQAHLIRADSGSLVLSTFKSVDRELFFLRAGSHGGRGCESPDFVILVIKFIIISVITLIIILIIILVII